MLALEEVFSKWQTCLKWKSLGIHTKRWGEIAEYILEGFVWFLILSGLKSNCTVLLMLTWFLWTQIGFLIVTKWDEISQSINIFYMKEVHPRTIPRIWSHSVQFFPLILCDRTGHKICLSEVLCDSFCYSINKTLKIKLKIWLISKFII